MGIDGINGIIGYLCNTQTTVCPYFAMMKLKLSPIDYSVKYEMMALVTILEKKGILSR